LQTHCKYITKKFTFQNYFKIKKKNFPQAIARLQDKFLNELRTSPAEADGNPSANIAVCGFSLSLALQQTYYSEIMLLPAQLSLCYRMWTINGFYLLNRGV